MSLYCRLLTINCSKIGSLKSWPLLLTKCWYSSTVGAKVTTTQDIKRLALKNLGADRERNRSFGKEVVIYENTRYDFYRNLSMFSLFNYILWTFLLNFGLFWYLTEYKDLYKTQSLVRPLEPIHNKEELSEDMVESHQSIDDKTTTFGRIYKLYKNYVLFSGFALIFGHLVLVGSVVFNVRSVSLITVRLGGSAETARIYCFSVFGLTNNYHKHDVPIGDISALTHRTAATGRYMNLKVKGQPLKFRVDRKGNFIQPLLFDETVGVFRKL